MTSNKTIFIWEDGDGAPKAFTSLKSARFAMLNGREKEFRKDEDLPEGEVWVWIPNREDNYIWTVELEK